MPPRLPPWETAVDQRTHVPLFLRPRDRRPSPPPQCGPKISRRGYPAAPCTSTYQVLSEGRKCPNGSTVVALPASFFPLTTPKHRLPTAAGHVFVELVVSVLAKVT